MPCRGGIFVKYFDELPPRSSVVEEGSKDFFDLFVNCWIALLADSPIDREKPPVVINQFLKRLVSKPLEVIASFAKLGHAVTLSHKLSPDGITFTGDFLSAMKSTPVFREYLHYVRTGDPRCLQFLLSFLNFGKKLKLETSQQSDVALREWLTIESRLEHYEMPSAAPNVKAIMAYLLGAWKLDAFLPKFGPGHVSEPGIRSVSEKCESFPYRQKIDLLINNPLFHYDEVGGPFPQTKQLLTQMPSCLEHSRLKFVFKDFEKFRTICMEPNDLQWLQQGLNLELDKCISSTVLSNHVFLRDQTYNQRAATFGSRTGRLDTTDLKSASDSVAWTLIKGTTPSSVLKYYYAARSGRVQLPDESVVQLHKFAPMGSAVCFPVQTLLFSAIVMMVGICWRLGQDWHEGDSILLSDDIESLYRMSFRTELLESVPDNDYRLDPFFVYGDDIITDHRITSQVIAALRCFGFTVNESKSYLGELAFRESCGIFAIGGHDVTPLIHKAKHFSGKLKIDELASYIDLANRAYDYGYTHLRGVLVSFVLHADIEGVSRRQTGHNPVLFSSDRNDSFSIFTEVPDNSHLKSRSFKLDEVLTTDRLKDLSIAELVSELERSYPTSLQYQRSEVQSISVGPVGVTRLSEKFDNYRLVSWWRSRQDRTVSSESSELVLTSAQGLGVRWRWTATPA